MQLLFTYILLTHMQSSRTTSSRCSSIATYRMRYTLREQPKTPEKSGSVYKAQTQETSRGLWSSLAVMVQLMS